MASAAHHRVSRSSYKPSTSDESVAPPLHPAPKAPSATSEEDTAVFLASAADRECSRRRSHAITYDRLPAADITALRDRLRSLSPSSHGRVTIHRGTRPQLPVTPHSPPAAGPRSPSSTSRVSRKRPPPRDPTTRDEARIDVSVAAPPTARGGRRDHRAHIVALLPFAPPPRTRRAPHARKRTTHVALRQVVVAAPTARAPKRLRGPLQSDRRAGKSSGDWRASRSLARDTALASECRIEATESRSARGAIPCST